MNEHFPVRVGAEADDHVERNRAVGGRFVEPLSQRRPCADRTSAIRAASYARSSVGLPGVTEPTQRNAHRSHLAHPAELVDGHAEGHRRTRIDRGGFGWIRRPDEMRPARDRILRRDGLCTPLERAWLALRKRAGDLPEIARVARQLLRNHERELRSR